MSEERKVSSAWRAVLLVAAGTLGLVFCSPLIALGLAAGVVAAVAMLTAGLMLWGVLWVLS